MAKKQSRKLTKYLPRAVFYQNAQGTEVPPDEDGRGKGYCDAYHRREWDGSPYCIFNELICAEIGRFLRLPIPAFAVTVHENWGRFFSSLDFNFDRDELPPIEPDRCVKRLPKESTGVVLFDVLIANEDRHDENLVVDDVMNPQVLRVFDHDQALFGGGGNLVGVERLEKLRDRMGISGGTVTGGNRHCLLDELQNVQFFPECFDRIQSLPTWFIEDVCESSTRYGLKKSEAKKAAEFLIYRRDNIKEIVRRNRQEFSGISSWKLPGQLLTALD